MTMKPALFIPVGEHPIEVYPENGKSFTLEELQNYIKGEGPGGKSTTVQWVPLPSGKVMICNDDGRLIGLEPNDSAMKFWADEYPIEKYPMNNDGLVVGNVLISPKRYVR